MAREDREPNHPLIERLEREPRQFNFFQAVRMLERVSEGAVPIGHRGPPDREAVRLRPSGSLAFQSTSVTRVTRREADGPDHLLSTTLLGLYGASSGLPAYYTEDILGYETANAPDPDPVRLFLDILNHRLLSLLYRSWEKYRWAEAFRADASDVLSSRVLTLLGVGEEGIARSVGLPTPRLLRYAGFITQRPRGADALAGVLSDYFGGPPVRVSQCVRRWVWLPERDRNRLGARNSRLGMDLVLGESAEDESGKFRVHLGPFGEEPRFEDFLPDSENARDLDALIGLLVPDPLTYDVEIRIEGQQVPAVRLGGGDDASRLGWTSWLLSGPADDTAEIFPPPQPRKAA
ncbi:MAG: type VI secretion system baseplate subunit TssG [Myxococcota bacterium]